MELEVKMPANVPDGVHSGKITEVQTTTIKNKKGETIPFLNVFIETNGIKLKYGCSQSLTPNSKLGKLISKFTTLVSGEKIDVNKILVDKNIMFQTTTNERGYSEIVVGSVKPA